MKSVLKKHKNVFNYLLILFTMFVSSCAMDNQLSNSGNSSQDLPYSFSNFTDIPIPERAEMSIDKTSIFGRDNNWLGKLVFSAPYSVGGVYDFYMEEMPKFGWSEITSVRGASSVLTFIRGLRVALIQLSPSTFNGTNIIFTVSPAPKAKKKIEKTNTRFQASKSYQEMKIPSPQNSSNSQTQNETKKDNMESINPADSSIFISSDAKKSIAGSLGLGDASNLNYKSNSKGVGNPPLINKI